MSYKTFEGTSNDGDLQEALTNAIDTALESTGVADEGVTWKLEEVKGEKGTIVGLNRITVTIQASFSSGSGK